MGRHRMGRHRLVPLVVALALGGAACGGSAGAGAQVATATGAGGSTDDKTAAERKVDAEKAGLEFARCMREHGVDMPDPRAGPDGGGTIVIGGSAAAVAAEGASEGTSAGLPDAFQEAEETCRHFLDDLILDGGPTIDPDVQDKALAFARCMREHGVDMPDPDFSRSNGRFGITIGGPDGGIDPGSDSFREAQEACGALFGPGGAGPATIESSAVSGRASS